MPGEWMLFTGLLILFRSASRDYPVGYLIGTFVIVAGNILDGQWLLAALSLLLGLWFWLTWGDGGRRRRRQLKKLGEKSRVLRAKLVRKVKDSMRSRQGRRVVPVPA